jgi:hypothetical protein
LNFRNYSDSWRTGFVPALCRKESS